MIKYQAFIKFKDGTEYKSSLMDSKSEAQYIINHKLRDYTDIVFHKVLEIDIN